MKKLLILLVLVSALLVSGCVLNETTSQVLEDGFTVPELENRTGEAIEITGQLDSVKSVATPPVGFILVTEADEVYSIRFEGLAEPSRRAKISLKGVVKADNVTLPNTNETWYTDYYISVLEYTVLSTGLRVYDLEFETVVQGDSGTQVEPLKLVIQDAAAWETFWIQTFADRKPTPDTPEVNFENDMLVAVFLGTRNTGGYSVGITNVQNKGTELLVQYREYAPDAGSIVTLALTQPHHIVTIPRSSLPVHFEKV